MQENRTQEQGQMALKITRTTITIAESVKLACASLFTLFSNFPASKFM